MAQLITRLLLKHEEPELDPWNPSVPVIPASTGDRELGGSLGLADQPIQLNQQTVDLVRNHVSKHKVEGDRGRHLASTPGLHMHVGSCMQTYTCAQRITTEVASQGMDSGPGMLVTWLILAKLLPSTVRLLRKKSFRSVAILVSLLVAVIKYSDSNFQEEGGFGEQLKVPSITVRYRGGRNLKQS